MADPRLDVLLYEWMSSYYNQNMYTDHSREEERRRRVRLGQFVMQCDAPGGSKKFRVFAGVEEAYNFIIAQPLAERTFYETIFDVHPMQKPYFDLDIIPDAEDPMDHAELLNRLLTEIKRVVGPELDLIDDVGVYSSHAPDGSKKSYHVVLTGYYVRGNIEAGNFAKSIRDGLMTSSSGQAESNFISRCLDLSVYKKLQQFRILGCTKLGRSRYKDVVLEYSAAGRSRQRLPVTDVKAEFLRSLITHVTSSGKYLDPWDYTPEKALVDEEPFANITLRALCSKRRRGIIPETLWLMDPLLIVSHVIDRGHLSLDLASNCHHPPMTKTGDQWALIILRSPPSRGYWCIICERKHDRENPYITLHEVWDSPAATVEMDRVIAIVFRCRREPAVSIRLCSIRGGSVSGAEFTCVEGGPQDPEKGNRTVREEIENDLLGNPSILLAHGV